MSDSETAETAVTFRITSHDWQEIDVPESWLLDLRTAEFTAIDADSYSKKATLHARSTFDNGESESVVETSPVCTVLLAKDPVMAKIKRLYVREMQPRFRIEGPAKVTMTGALTLENFDEDDESANEESTARTDEEGKDKKAEEDTDESKK